eukprot:Lithocolla_globosa_v1_NODE_4935_length_1336_cov_2.612802.p3 type:complete len:101 gc:universal NODE_4935_length_1336_cov_2.612802:517-215(-)
MQQRKKKSRLPTLGKSVLYSELNVILVIHLFLHNLKTQYLLHQCLSQTLLFHWQFVRSTKKPSLIFKRLCKDFKERTLLLELVLIPRVKKLLFLAWGNYI